MEANSGVPKALDLLLDGNSLLILIDVANKVRQCTVSPMPLSVALKEAAVDSGKPLAF